MKPFLLILVLSLLVPAIGQENVLAQSKTDLVGTWKLVSATETTKKGEVRGFGHNPTGFITYTADGRVMLIITNGGRKPLSTSDYTTAPIEERAEAFATMTAYAGHYTLNGDKVIHHIEVLDAKCCKHRPSASYHQPERQLLDPANSPDKLPIDPNGVYFVLASKNVMQQSVPSQFCAWHSYGIAQDGKSGSGTAIKVAFIGDSDQFPSACQWQNPSPNNNPAADAAANFIAHELSETVTDPEFNAWTNPGVIENGDLCQWTFGTTKLLPNGSSYNLIFGTRPYLIQRIWVNARGGYCALALDE
ncbi:MAG: hypothetical protein DMG32_07125 [Acidobacteria bacterium]|nr:MAG: hypothetical protein DMG32_07125 [Acidobacteriota bacterium]